MVFDAILSGKNSFDDVKEELRSRGHMRRDHDIKNMARHLERAGLVENYAPTEFGEKVKVFIRNTRNLPFDHQGNDRNVLDLVKLTGVEILRTFYRNGFLLSSFLKALQQPATNQMISARFFQNATSDGFYNINAETDYNDFVPSMKNFAVYLGFARRLEQRGKVELTPLAEEILNLDPAAISDRKRCDVELCRKICPAGAIFFDYIDGCVNCGLCARCCPKGATQCKDGKVQFNFSKCSPQSPNVPFKTCGLNLNLNEIIGSERTMQQWIVNLLRICKLKAIVPGPGEKPDIVLNRVQNSTVFECKNSPITGRKLERLGRQLKRYMNQELIRAMEDDLNTQWAFPLEKPDVFFVCAPERSSVEEIIGDIGSRLHYPLSFISSEAFFELHKKVMKKAEIDRNDLIQLFSRKRYNISDDLINIVNA
ncbi:MAG: hypothetical protein ACFFCS_02230 [Candidatus Hodarchaeota archaeon]